MKLLENWLAFSAWSTAWIIADIDARLDYLQNYVRCFQILKKCETNHFPKTSKFILQS